MDEANVDRIVHEQIALEQIAARRRRALAEHEAKELKRGNAIARRRLEQEELEAEARAEAKQELAAEGLLPAPKKETAQQAHKELLIHEKNLALEQANRKLEQEAQILKSTLYSGFLESIGDLRMRYLILKLPYSHKSAPLRKKFSSYEEEILKGADL